MAIDENRGILTKRDSLKKGRKAAPSLGDRLRFNTPLGARI